MFLGFIFIHGFFDKVETSEDAASNENNYYYKQGDPGSGKLIIISIVEIFSLTPFVEYRVAVVYIVNITSSIPIVVCVISIIQSSPRVVLFLG